MDCLSSSVGLLGYHAAMLCNSDHVDDPMTSLVGGHASYPSGTTEFPPFEYFIDLFTSLLLSEMEEDEEEIRPSAAVKADLVSSQAGRSQSSPPIDFKKDGSGGEDVLSSLLFAPPPMVSLERVVAIDMYLLVWCITLNKTIFLPLSLSLSCFTLLSSWWKRPERLIVAKYTK